MSPRLKTEKGFDLLLGIDAREAFHILRHLNFSQKEKRGKRPSVSTTLRRTPFSERLLKELILPVRNLTPTLNNILILKGL